MKPPAQKEAREQRGVHNAVKAARPKQAPGHRRGAGSALEAAGARPKEALVLACAEVDDEDWQ